VLFPKRLWPAIADGTVTVAFRRWKAPRARVGAAHRTPAGLLRITGVEVMDTRAITEADARAAGHPNRAALLDALHGEGDVFRVEFRHEGPDPREALRRQDKLQEADWQRLEARLRRLDAASRRGPWTKAVLELISEHPQTLAADLAASMGRDKPSFKRDVRKLKELGLTESLERGYRLSPRGRALLRRL
jgi:DNA-binding transcriptional ArsR family regulator